LLAVAQGGVEDVDAVLVGLGRGGHEKWSFVSSRALGQVRALIGVHIQVP
jgi:hypothetical protein